MDTHELACYEKAGKVAHKALLFGKDLIRPGASMKEVLDKVESFIRENGCKPAFPAQSCVNEVAAHFCPTDHDDYTYKEGDLVKLDVGAHCEGFIGDNALTVDLNSPYTELSQATREALDAVSRMLGPGTTLDEIGRTVQDVLQTNGFEPVRNLTGHGVARFSQHTSPSIPNYPTGDSTALEEGMVIAIEPFGTTGDGLIYTSGNPTVFSLVSERPVRSPHGRQVLEMLRKFNGLPFTTRWLTKELGGRGILGLNELRRAGMIAEYPPLPEKSGGIVSQWEHTFLITNDGCRILTSE